MLSLGPNVLCFSFEANLLCYTATRCFIVCHKCKRSVDNFNEGGTRWHGLVNLIDR